MCIVSPIFGLILFLCLCGLVAMVAKKKGRSGIAFFLCSALPAVPLMLVVSYSLGENIGAKPAALSIAAFVCPVIGFISAVMSNSNQQMAVSKGSFGDYKKCPFCAEPVRQEAIKCKHCGSSLEK
jgi:hypothetical protein